MYAMLVEWDLRLETNFFALVVCMYVMYVCMYNFTIMHTFCCLHVMYVDSDLDKNQPILPRLIHTVYQSFRGCLF